MTFEQAFLKIKAKLDNVDTTKLSNSFAIQVNMTNEDCGGAFYIQFTDGKLFVEPYDYRDNTADVTLLRENLNKILDKKLTVSSALESGTLFINGNRADFESVVDAVKAPEKKVTKKAAAPKKATAKKADTKTAAKKAEVKPAVKAEAKPTEKKAEVKPTVKAEVKVPEKKTEVKTTAKKTTK